jgi:hypothetical protein
MEAPTAELVSVAFAMLPLLAMLERWTKRPMTADRNPSQPA